MFLRIKLRKTIEIALGVFLALNPIVFYWLWLCYADFYFVGSYLVFLSSLLLGGIIFSYRIESISIINVALRAVVLGIFISILSQVFFIAVNNANYYILVESNIVSWLLHVSLLSFLLPYALVSQIYLFVIRFFRKNSL